MRINCHFPLWSEKFEDTVGHIFFKKKTSFHIWYWRAARLKTAFAPQCTQRYYRHRKTGRTDLGEIYLIGYISPRGFNPPMPGAWENSWTLRKIQTIKRPPRSTSRGRVLRHRQSSSGHLLSRRWLFRRGRRSSGDWRRHKWRLR